MLDVNKVWQALARKQGYFHETEASRQHDMVIAGLALETLPQFSLALAEERLAGIVHPGARPTSELDLYQSVALPFGPSWSNHQEARQWALSVLRDRPTFAADGSQIPASKEISLPIALVQVGWFENPHRIDGRYVKDVQVEVLSPAELASHRQAIGNFPDWQVNLLRFTMELRVLGEYMRAQANANPKPVCFFDGSFVISFVQHLFPDEQRLYTAAVRELLATSAETRVPVVGFVDQSAAKDLVDMLKSLMGISVGNLVSDAGLLESHMEWGARSQVFICARDDGVLDKAYYDQVYFTYLKTTAGNPPARVEFPRWVYEADMHEELLDVVRAECVVGTGYPYALETADATAVLQAEDRERFFAILQQFAESDGLRLRFAAKPVSKRRRRK